MYQNDDMYLQLSMVKNGHANRTFDTLTLAQMQDVLKDAQTLKDDDKVQIIPPSFNGTDWELFTTDQAEEFEHEEEYQ